MPLRQVTSLLHSGNLVIIASRRLKLTLLLSLARDREREEGDERRKEIERRQSREESMHARCELDGEMKEDKSIVSLDVSFVQKRERESDPRCPSQACHASPREEGVRVRDTCFLPCVFRCGSGDDGAREGVRAPQVGKSR